MRADQILSERPAPVAPLPPWRVPKSVPFSTARSVIFSMAIDSWSVRHFHERYVEDHGGRRSYTWVKNRLQGAGLVKRGRRRGRHRLRRPRKPLEGLMVHQDGSTHEWVPGRVWDLIVTSDDATGRVYSGLCVAEEGTWSSFRGVRETVEAKGLFASLYTDRGSHYWHTPKAGEKVDRSRPTQFGRAMGELGIEMIPSYSPQARGRCERLFRTLQGRLPNELAREGIADMGEANEYLGAYWPRFNAAFGVEAAGEGTAFVPLSDVRLDDILCLREARTVGNDNCVSYRGKRLQIAPQPHRYPLRAGEGPGTRVRGREHVGVPRQAPAGPLRPAGMSAGDLERGGRDGVTRDTAPAPARYARLCGAVFKPDMLRATKPDNFICSLHQLSSSLRSPGRNRILRILGMCGKIAYPPRIVYRA